MPLALVLTGGGARAAYQAGAMLALAELRPDLPVPIITGVSAGAINAAYLAAHTGPFERAAAGLREQWDALDPQRVYRFRPAGITFSALRRFTVALVGQRPGPAHLPGVLDPTPLRRHLSGVIRFEDIDVNIAAGRLRALALSATPYVRRPTHTFVHAAPGLTMWERAERIAVPARIGMDHVLASSAIPLIFPAVWLDGEFYGDGSVRFTAPLAPAIHLGADQILVIGTRHPGPEPEQPRVRPESPTAAEGMGLLFNAIFLDALEADTERLERINKLLAAIPPGMPVPDDLRPIRLLHLRPSRSLAAMVGTRSRRLPWALKLILRAMGGEGQGSDVLLSYLLFEPEYTSSLIALGYEDTRARASEVEDFLDRAT